MSFKLALAITGLVCLSAVLATPVSKQETPGEVKVPATLHPYSESNETYSTFEEIMAEIAATKAGGEEPEDGHSINKRALGCAKTRVAYGSTTGTAFSDFTSTNPWPCGVDITQINIRHGSLIDSIQMTYQTVDRRYILGTRRGGGGGGETVIRLAAGERITGASGMVCTFTRGSHIGGTLVHQLAFSSQKQDGQKVVYGPYGIISNIINGPNCRMFHVNGKINSIFGRIYSQTGGSFIGLGAIGFYYEDESTFSQNTD